MEHDSTEYDAIFPHQHRFQTALVLSKPGHACWIDGNFKLDYGCTKEELDDKLAVYFRLVQTKVDKIWEASGNLPKKSAPTLKTSPHAPTLESSDSKWIYELYIILAFTFGCAFWYLLNLPALPCLSH
jgi:hypothetical protein